ncbi:MAG: GGDEF domain-containing protein [Clostridia bacterium]|nr:GGDEF domain-containing protein [Clostridia bacterium]
MHSLAVYYIEANIVCTLVFGINLVHNHFNIDRQEKQLKYDRVLTVFMLYFLLDCFWALIVAGIIPKTRVTIVVDVFAMYILMAMTTYSWLEYVMAYEQVPRRNRPINRFAVLFPFIVSTVALIIHYVIAPRTLLNDALDTTPVIYIYLVAVPYIYLSAILFYTVRKARSEKMASEKRRHLFIGLLPLVVIIGGVVEIVFFPYIPIYCFCAMALMLIFYIRSIELRISVDPLTQLNNRSQLTHYISLKSNLSVEGRMTIVIMMDIDGFKHINDTYGHAEGDRALVLVSESLKKAVNNHSMPSFLCRYGGDEFILIIHPVFHEETDKLISEIRDEIKGVVCDAPFPLSISIGYDELLGEDDSIQSCIRRADKKLYLDKEYRKIKASTPASNLP